MILKASQRGGGKQLAQHLMRADENEHVELHEVRGFVSQDAAGALHEAHAVSQATRCNQFLFSVSLNPPQHERVPVETFEDTINRIEERNNLSGQPRVVVFHEKEGRRHAHAVWSRIDPETMTARNLPFFKSKLRDLSREIYLAQGWTMPRGLVNSKERDPRNFTLAEWQQAKRQGLHARDLKTMMQDCWATSDSRAAFQQALAERGMSLAQGDRRGHVAVTHDGAVLSIARYTDKKTKDVRAKLGEPDKLPSVDDARLSLSKDMGEAVQRHIAQAKSEYAKAKRPLDVKRTTMTAKHRDERTRLDYKQKERAQRETKDRAARLHGGIKGVWQALKGEAAKIRSENERATWLGLKRDRDQRQMLINAQLKDRQELQKEIKAVRDRYTETLLQLRSEKQHYKTIEQTARDALKDRFENRAKPTQSRTERQPPQRNIPDHLLERLNRPMPTPQERLARGARGTDRDRER